MAPVRRHAWTKRKGAAEFEIDYINLVVLFCDVRSKGFLFFQVQILWAVLGIASLIPITSPGQNAPGVVRIGYQKSGAFLLLKNEGSLEKNLTPLGYRVEWKEFPSGPPLLEALNAGSLDVGHSGDAPLIFAQSAGIDFEYIGASSPAPESAGIVVPNGSTIQTVSELRGKRVAFAKGSSSHFLLARALQEAGLGFNDIKPVYLQPSDARAAFQSGSVDAWAIWDPFYAAAEIDGKARVLRSGEGLSAHREFYFARKDFLAAHPEIVTPLLAALRETGERALKDPAATAKFLASRLGISDAIMLKSELRKPRYGAEPMSPESIAEQQQVADTFFQLGLVPKAVRAGDAVFQTKQ
jgi:sulfonate transport system substrate-binding protein